jgi:hypothetical protein
LNLRATRLNPTWITCLPTGLHNKGLFLGVSPLKLADRPDLDDLPLDIQRRHDGALLVRVPSAERNGGRLPDAVFSFRAGDPQYAFWAELLASREADAFGT